MTLPMMLLAVFGSIYLSLTIKNPITVLILAALYGAALGAINALYFPKKK